MTDVRIEPKHTALVLIDLQHGIVGRGGAPRSGEAVVANAARVADACRKHGMLVVLVHVLFSADGSDRLRQPVDETFQMPGGMPANWAEIVPEIGPRPGDHVIAKRQWGAFYGTDLDLQLRRRGIRTILLGGIATNYGVESTARDAWERNYELILVEDAMTSLAPEAHELAIKYVFPRLGRVRSTAHVLARFPPAK
jgi:nicotinamidase-related amidase